MNNENKDEIQEILDKKLLDHQLLYLVRKEGRRKWVRFDEIKHNINIIAQYERKMKNQSSHPQLHETHQPTFKSPQSFQQKIANLRKKKSSTEKIPKNVENIIFTNQLNDSLIFRVIFTDKSEKMMDNLELKELYPQELISFYENNILIREEPQD